MERKCKIVTKWSSEPRKKDMSRAQYTVKLGLYFSRGGSASFLKTGVENSPDFAIVALRGLSFL